MRPLLWLVLFGGILVYACGWLDPPEGRSACASIAATRGDVQALWRLKRQGLDVNTRFGNVTVLADAAGAGQESCVRALLEMGARVDAASVEGITPLMWGALWGNAPTLEVLIEGGADVNARNCFGYTPLMYAAMSGDARRVRVLLAAGADPDSTNSQGCDAAEVAASYGQAEMSVLLSRLRDEPRAAVGSHGMTVAP